MDILHAKAASDLCRNVGMTEDAFYDRFSCDWLQGFRSATLRLKRPKVPPRVHLAQLSEKVEP